MRSTDAHAIYGPTKATGDDSIGFVLAGNRLVTVRYAAPKPFLLFAEHVRREPQIARDAMNVLVRLLDASSIASRTNWKRRRGD